MLNSDSLPPLLHTAMQQTIASLPQLADRTLTSQQFVAIAVYEGWKETKK